MDARRITLASDGSMQRSSVLERVRTLKQVPLFAGLDDAALESLTGITVVRSYGRRDPIADPQETDYCWILVHGAARAFGLSSKGREITLERLTVGSVYGPVFLEETVQGRSYLEATVDGTVVYRIPVRAIEALCLSHPVFARAVLRLLSRSLDNARCLIEDIALHDVRTRLAHVIARLAAENDRHVVTETHRELAALTGTRPEEVTKLLRPLRDEGLLTYGPDRHTLFVLDLERLASYGM